MKTNKEKIFWGSVVVMVLCVLYVSIWLNGLSYRKTLAITPQANITVIPGQVIPSPDISLLSLITPTVTSDPTTIDETGIHVGAYIQIAGTGGAGLNVRNSADINSEKIFIADESEVFLVVGGPISDEEHVWWQLSAPYNQERQGWAVEDYLVIIHP